MKKLLGRVALLGILVGVIVALRNRVEGRTPEGDTHVVFDDNSSVTLGADTAEGREFADIARKLVETGV